MNKWIIRISIALNVLVILAALGAWFNRMAIIGIYLDWMYEQKTDAFATFPIVEGDVVMLGDSITDAGYWNEMFPKLPIKNRGIGGDTTTGVLRRLELISQGRPAAVFIKIGTNDLTHGPERSVSYEQYRQIVSTIKEASPTTHIYLQSLLPRAAELQDEVEQYNEVIQQVAADLGVIYINLYPTFLAEDGSMRDELTGDELHLNGKGYLLWQSILQPYMSQYSSVTEFR
ncbi:MAG: lysophospholipase L1-like esterase [Halioglobus sp.]|jgi:lysophospholipase L1-like esterase